MTTDITRFTGGTLHRRIRREARREVANVEATAVVRASRVQAIGFNTEAALFTVAGLTRTQRELEQVLPEAALRLAIIADAGTSAIAADIVRMGL